MAVNLREWFRPSVRIHYNSLRIKHWGKPHGCCSCNHCHHGSGEESAAKCFRFFCHSYNPHNPPQIRLDFRLSIQDCPRTSPALFDFHTMKLWQREKYGLGDGCTILFFSTDDGCTCWWRWLHQLRWVISWFEGLLVRVEQCAEFGAIPSRNTPLTRFTNSKLGKSEASNTERSHGCLDHRITIRHQKRKYRCRSWALPHDPNYTAFWIRGQRRLPTTHLR